MHKTIPDAACCYLKFYQSVILSAHQHSNGKIYVHSKYYATIFTGDRVLAEKIHIQDGDYRHLTFSARAVLM